MTRFVFLCSRAGERVWRSTVMSACVGCLLASCDDDKSQATDKSPIEGDEDASIETHDSGPNEPPNTLSFFVSSDTSTTANLGGLAGADARCQRLAEAAGAGDRTFRAYLSVERDASNGGAPTHARDRIGKGPWYNARGALVAEDVEALHARLGDANVFLDEKGEKINGQWEGSPTPNQHDILTGSDPNGRVVSGKTCSDWTSAEAGVFAQVGHSDGLGPMRNGAAPFNSWQSSHESAGCNDTAPRGGAGKIYCFASD
jgi:hypothetical protein